MGDKAEYRSAVRSRERIRRAFADLIHERGTTRITVKDLVQRADVNRSTFYAHYADINAVLEEIEREVIHNLFAFLDASEPTAPTALLHNPLPFLMRIGLELERNQAYYRLLMPLRDADRAMLADVLVEVGLLREPAVATAPRG
jgi:AcrR family transcriptional regulator